MTIGYIVALRNSMLDEIAALVDAGAGAGFLRIYDGARPATGGAATTLLAELTMNATSFAAAAAGVLTANAITPAAANAAGTATWFRITDSDGNAVYDGSAGGTASGEDLELTTVTLSIGLNVSISSLTITEGNP